MMLRRFLFLLALALFFFGCKTNSANEENSESGSKKEKTVPEKEYIPAAELNAYKQKLSAYFDSTLLRGNFNGAILVAKGGHLLYESYIGYTDPIKKLDTITPHTAFHLASTSKPFTGVAVMKLVEQGRIGLEDDIIKYFSGFPYSGVTVGDLLSHRSGLPNYLYFMDDKQKWDQNRMVSNKDVLDFLITHQPPKSYSPGIRFNYCNTNYVLLALIVEKVTGTPFPQYLKETIFDPLGMADTYVYTHADSARSIMSYQPSGALWANDKYEYTYGDKNIYSTPRDMFKWDSALYREDFASKALLDSSFVPRSHEKPSVHNYGYGWRLLNLKNGKNVHYHNGKWHGFTPAFTRLDDEKAVIIILGNRYSRNNYNVAKNAYDIFGNYSQVEDTIPEEGTPLTDGAGDSAPAKKEKKAEVIPVVKKKSTPQKKPEANPATKPTVKTVVKTTAKPAAKTVAKTTAKPAIKPAAKTAVKPAAKTVAKTSLTATPKKQAPPAKNISTKTGGKTGISKPVSKPPPKTAPKKKVSKK